MVSVRVQPKGRAPAVAPGLPTSLSFGAKTLEAITVGDVKRALHDKYPKFYPERQRLSLLESPKPLDDEATLSSAGDALYTSNPGGEGVLVVKDLGPQISWRTVFLVEYAGPLVIHPIVYHLPQLIYRQAFEHSQMQKVVYVLVLLHFLKRELETVLVHRFSHATMPARNIFKNSAHYHILSGFVLSLAVYGPWFSATSPKITDTFRSNPTWIWSWVAVWAFAELSNLQAHLTLRWLRPAGTRARGIPRGYLFEYVSCPNYFTEALAWVAVTALSGSWSAGVFLFVSTVQMALWAIKKHRAYRKEFGKDYPRRKIMFPFLF
ncbi:hypothetical protein BOTBODRAFT_32192 [Botryobasidium botryosum FD-172 SS1]|uniref:Uncharacterized protein n=1 Tax=Botryobasidium botryosum (strain FD-172 SS1) TaxID=930990 RepID=A0A067MSP4_BOTB1|nr:hypothetical protein BOTBODRAFT_32192 [Botryobasidium botryosum FD-172 SS1]